MQATAIATIGVRSCHLPALTCLKLSVKPSATASTGSFDQALRPQPSATIGIYGRSRLPFARPQRPKTRCGSFDQALRPQPCYYRRSRLPFARPQRPKTLRGSFDQARRPQPSATTGVRGCHLPALKGIKRSAAASTRHAGHSHLLLSAFEAAVCPPSQ